MIDHDKPALTIASSQPGRSSVTSDSHHKTGDAFPAKVRFLSCISWIMALALTVVLIGFHIVRANHAGAMWRDEWSTVAVAEQPTLGALYNQLSVDSFPALADIVLRVWRATGWGASEQGLRTFGMLVGLLLVGLLWRNAWCFGQSPPLLSLALFALSPVVIQWGDSIRAYGLGTFLAVLTLRLLWEFVSAPRPAPAVAAAIAAVLSVQCLYQNAFLLFAGSIAALTIAVIRRRWMAAGTVIAIGIISASSLLLYLPILARLHEVQELVARPNGETAVWEVLFAALTKSGGAMPWAWAVAGALALAIASLPFVLPAGRFMQPSSQDLALFAGISLLAGLGTFGVYLLMLQFPVNVWYFVPIWGFAATCLDASLCAVSPARMRQLSAPAQHPLRKILLAFGVLAAALVAGVACFTIEPCFRQIHERQTNLDEVARILESRAVDGDVILIIPNLFAASFFREYKRHDPILTLPQHDTLSFQRLDDVRRAMARAHPIDATLERLATALRDGHHVYIFAYLLSPPAGKLPPVLPPAPRKETGWYMEPYLVSWEMQTARFLQLHALHATLLDVPKTGAINDKEFVPNILVVEGWRPGSK